MTSNNEADPTAGERCDGSFICDATEHEDDCFAAAPDAGDASASAGEPLSEDVEMLTAILADWLDLRSDDTPQDTARLVLASDWLAAREAKARATMPEPDNHHNALACPYCTDDLDDRLAKARAEAGEQALLDAADDYERMYQQPGSATGADWLRLRAARIAREVTP